MDVQQALHANGPEAKGTKENVSDTQEQVSARVIFKNHILPEKTYGATEKFYYSAGEYYILKYQNGEAAKEAVKKLKGDYPGTLVVQDRIVSIKTEDEPQTEEPENADTPSQTEGEEESSPENNEDSKATPKSNGEGENAQEDAQEEEDDSQAEARNLYFPFPYNGTKSMGLDKLKESRNWGTGEVKVAVIDSGINKVNEYFTNRIDERNSVNFAVDSPNQPENYGDIYGHGSHVAGIITKSTPENVKIMAIRVFDVTTTASLSTINLGIHHADEHDADIINLSLAPPNYKEGKHSTSMTLFYYVHSTHKTKNKKTAGDVLSLTAKNYSFISLLFCRLLCTFCIYILVHIVYQLVQTIGKMYVFQSHIIRYF